MKIRCYVTFSLLVILEFLQQISGGKSSQKLKKLLKYKKMYFLNSFKLLSYFFIFCLCGTSCRQCQIQIFFCIYMQCVHMNPVYLKTFGKREKTITITITTHSHRKLTGKHRFLKIELNPDQFLSSWSLKKIFSGRNYLNLPYKKMACSGRY